MDRPDLSKMNRRARSRTNDTEKNMPFRPKIRGSLLDKLEQMAGAADRDPNDLLHELIDAATSNDAPPSPAPRGKAPPMPSTAPQTAPQGNVRPDGTRIAKVVTVPLPEGPRLGETIAQAKRRENGETEDAAASASDDEGSGDAPPEKMKGGRPNPLNVPTSKRWAGKKDDSAPTASPKTQEQDSVERLRRKYLKRG